MDKEKLKKALDSAYELEAMIEIAIVRDPLPDRIKELIAQKMETLHTDLTIAGLDLEDTGSPGEYTEEPSGYPTPGEEEDRPLENEGNDKPEEPEISVITSRGNTSFTESPAGGKDLKKMFSINDTFRFRRELFSNSQNDFIDSLNLVTAMKSYSEAEEYFYTDLQWDPENADVEAFMSTIANYFGE